jgi:hypothetical protein
MIGLRLPKNRNVPRQQKAAHAVDRQLIFEPNPQLLADRNATAILRKRLRQLLRYADTPFLVRFGSTLNRFAFANCETDGRFLSIVSLTDRFRRDAVR